MAEVDPSDDSIESYTVRHHRFDPVTNHFRWFDVKTFDNQAEMHDLMNEIFQDIERRRLVGEAKPKEQVAGTVNETNSKGKAIGTGWSAYQPLE